MKRVLAILMAAIMMVSLSAVNVFAAETSEPPTHTHVFEQKTLITQPTCLTEGIVISYCTGDGECELPGRMWTEPQLKVPCSPTEEPLGALEATCTMDGYTGDYRCKWCLSILDEGEIIPKTGHTPGDWLVDGWNTNWHTTVRVRFCTTCKQIVDREELPTDPDNPPEALKPHDHVFGETVIETAPTCQSEGLSVTVCTADGFCDLIGRTKTEVLPKVECSPSDVRIGQRDATCYLEGQTGDQICKWCLTVLEESEATPKAEHTLGDWITDEWSSDDTVIVRRRFCTVCLQQVSYEEITLDQPYTPFIDVAKDAYYYDSVLWAYENKITGGTSATTFSPDKVCTRAEVVTMLWRAAGSPAPLSLKVPFTDVSADAYYHDAVLWAVDYGVTAGTTESTFSPDAPCTRAQVMTMLWRAKGSILTDRTTEAFLDVDSDDYFYLPVLWAVENDITRGTGFFLFSPDAPCSRGQIVTFLYKAK